MPPIGVGSTTPSGKGEHSIHLARPSASQDSFAVSDLLELQIRGGIEDNSKIIFLISQQKHRL